MANKNYKMVNKKIQHRTKTKSGSFGAAVAQEIATR
jgi:hypothetical protein